MRVRWGERTMVWRKKTNRPQRRDKQKSDTIAWFDVRKYDRLRDFGASQWFKELLVRSRLREEIDSPAGRPQSYEYQELYDTIEILCQNPLDYANLLPNYRQTEINNYHLESTEYVEAQGGASILTREQFWLLEAWLEVNGFSRSRDFALKSLARTLACQYNPSPLGAVAFERLFCEYEGLDPVDDWESPIPESAVLSTGTHLLAVNLNCPNAILEEQFKTVIAELRRKEQVNSASAIERPPFHHWINCGLLPYIDLVLWADIRGVRLTYPQIAKAVLAGC